jgi:hypothetical protein
MPYIGRPLNAGNLAVQSGTGDGSDTTPIATLDYSVGSSNSIGVYLDGVRQLAGTDFTASGTTLTFTTAPANGVGIDVYFLGLELSIPTPADATVTTAKIAANAVDETKLKDALIADFTEVTVAAGDSILLGDATDSGNTKRDTVQGLLDLVPAGSTLGSEQATTTGDTITFGSIPSGVKMILLCFNGVSNGGVDLLVRLGDGGGIETSGYVGGSTILITDNSITGGSGTTGFVLKGDNDANIHTGIVTMVNIDSTNHDWVMNYSGIAETNHTLLGGATKSLSAELTQLDVNIASGAFDAGSMNILYF